MNKIRLFEMFAGYGGASFSLKRVGIPFESVGYSEIDKGAIKCYEQNHQGKNYGDCSKIDPNELPDFDFLTGGFPCQDVSIAGNRNLSKGRTNLYLEILRIAKHKKPKYMLLENVKGLLSVEVEERKLIDIIISDLQKLGYGVVWKVLNSRDYGTPQNRERIWIVCKLGGWDFMEFMFPEKRELKIKLKDILQKEVEKKYYLSDKQINKIIERNKNFNMKGNRTISSNNDCFSGLTTNLSQNDILKITSHSLFPRSGNPKQGGTGHLSKEDGTSYCLDTGNAQCIEISNSSPREFKLQKEVSPSLLSRDYKEPKLVLQDKQIWRRLIPKECFRLMGFEDGEINLENLSNTQLYKLAGNGWDINVVTKILKKVRF